MRNLVVEAMAETRVNMITPVSLLTWLGGVEDSASAIALADEGMRRTLDWFDELPAGEVDAFFPKGPMTGDTSRRDNIVTSFDAARELSRSVDRNLPTSLRVGFLAKVRKVCGDHRVLLPRELVKDPRRPFAQFRRTDLLSRIQKLGIENCDAAAHSDGDDNEKLRQALGCTDNDALIRHLETLRFGLSCRQIFNDIAEISGLDMGGRREVYGDPEEPSSRL